MNVSQTYIWRRLSGEVELSLTDLEQIADALDSPVDRLLTDRVAA